MKTPDEIKKALRLCDAVCCTLDCPYFRSTSANCVKKLHKNAIAYIKQLEAKARASVIHHAEPKNHVLTLEEVAKSEVMWYDDRLRTRAQVVILGWGRCEPDFTKLVDRCGDEFYRKNASYNDFWRCWLRKPTETERWETPWES